jgi:hypothetical protein
MLTGIGAMASRLLDVSCAGQRSGPITCNLLLNLAEGEIEMLEQSASRNLSSLRAGLLAWALSQALFTQAWAAESLPASVRACAAEVDRERRLDCFDREVARFPDSKAPSQATRTQPAARPAPPPNTPVPPAAAQTAATPPAPDAGSTEASSGTAKPGRIAARLVSIDRAANEMVLHLDNGQTWEEVQSVAGDLSLKVGDNVTIDKRLGSHWLTGPHVSGMKVRQRN